MIVSEVMTKTEIIEAAFRVWGREFYLDTSLSRLAKELKVSKPALYRHFESKQALFDAMTVYFFDDISAFIQTHIGENQSDGENKEFALIRAVAEYYGRNVNAFIFALIRVYDSPNDRCAEDEMKARGVDMRRYETARAGAAHPLVMRMIFSTVTFFMADFHRRNKSLSNPPSEESVRERIKTIIKIIQRGYGYDGEIDALDYEKLEGRVTGLVNDAGDDPLLKAVGGAIAETGPWEISMEQVARRLGLSKSSLYGHFRNKRDMLRRFFVNEFARILDFTRQGMALSENQVERFYLGVFSIAAYLHTRPEILAALDWIRTRGINRLLFTSSKNSRKADTGDNALPPEFFALFDGFDKTPLGGGGESESARCMTHWMLFLVVGVLTRYRQADAKEIMQNEDIRTLFRLITLGIRGFSEK